MKYNDIQESINVIPMKLVMPETTPSNQLNVYRYVS